MQITNPIFTDADKARVHLEAINWPLGPVCPHCGEHKNVTRLKGKSHRAGLIQCNACAKNFTVTVGTVFERSKVPLNKWLLATYLLSSSKKGISAKQIERMLGVTYKTAWFMMHRIREAMKTDDTTGFGSGGGVAEADETFIGKEPGMKGIYQHCDKPICIATLPSSISATPTAKTVAATMANAPTASSKAFAASA